jgi:hypothetical protein
MAIAGGAVNAPIGKDVAVKPNFGPTVRCRSHASGTRATGAEMTTHAETEIIATKIAIEKLRREDGAAIVAAVVDESRGFVRRGAVLKPAGGHARKEQTCRIVRLRRRWLSRTPKWTVDAANSCKMITIERNAKRPADMFRVLVDEFDEAPRESWPTRLRMPGKIAFRYKHR